MQDIVQRLETREGKVGVVGLGYVGLPLACLFAERGYAVVGYDVNPEKIQNLQQRRDLTKQVDYIPEGMEFTDDPRALRQCALLLVCVPTPRQGDHLDLRMIKGASRVIAQNISTGTIICYESSVYPGLTEELMAQFYSNVVVDGQKLELGVDFYVGYSPERINPGDKHHTLDKINKLVSGDSVRTAETLAQIYSKVLDAKVHVCPSIKVAEMAKIYENIQRATLIALSNELALHCKALGIESKDVLDACATKWNFVNVRPGFVMGDCLPVNPVYYLKTQAGHPLDLVRQVRATNEGMPNAIAAQMNVNMPLKGTRIGIFGVAYKENIGDFRGTCALDLEDELKSMYEVGEVVMHDPHVDPGAAKHLAGILLEPTVVIGEGMLDAAVITVAHDEYKDEEFLDRLAHLLNFSEGHKPWIFDMKGCINPERCEELGINYWRL